MGRVCRKNRKDFHGILDIDCRILPMLVFLFNHFLHILVLTFRAVTESHDEVADLKEKMKVPNLI